MMNIGSIWFMTTAGRTVIQKLERVSEMQDENKRGHIHGEYTELEIARTVAELEERERDEQRDEDADEEPSEDVVGRAPKSQIVALHHRLQLIEERRRICHLREFDPSRSKER